MREDGAGETLCFSGCLDCFRFSCEFTCLFLPPASEMFSQPTPRAIPLWILQPPRLATRSNTRLGRSLFLTEAGSTPNDK